MTIFISYASEQIDLALALATSLEEQGQACFVAARDLRGGVIYGVGISDALRRSSALVVLLSSESMTSEHVQTEVELAKNRIPWLLIRLPGAPDHRIVAGWDYWIGPRHVSTWEGPQDAAKTVLALLVREPSPGPPAVEAGSEALTEPLRDEEGLGGGSAEAAPDPTYPEFTRDLLKEAGLTLSDAESAWVPGVVQGLLEARIGAEIIESLLDEEVEQLLEAQEVGPPDVFQEWLRTNVPDLLEIVQDEFDILLGEISQDPPGFRKSLQNPN